ncbi:MAG: ABC transporter ATP-binding protein [Parachlamydiaceae bacterium]|nr:ABC transporter ATP-binding protein [Parachlamydiaceae bacterium]
MNPPILEIKNLTKKFTVNGKTLHAVQDVSFSIPHGQTLGLAGESGCGKSTIGKMIVRLINPSDGTILFNGNDISKMDGKEIHSWRRKSQMIFQNPSTSLNPRMTIEEILLEPYIIHNRGCKDERKEWILSLVDQVGLQEFHLQRLPHELSGGQKQRVAIARALALNPDLIVCDEPLSALDVSIQAQIVNLLKELQQRNKLTYLFISHDLSVMREFADHMAIMYLGHLVELAPSKLLYERPLHPYTQALLSAIPVPDPVVERKRSRIILKGEIPSPLAPPSGCPFHTRCPFVQDICRKEKPQLREVARDHFAACHFSGV